MKTRLNKGFTLIELLVVIAIIGILSGIVLTSLNSARTKAKDARIVSSVSQVRTIAEVGYVTSYSNFPGDSTYTALAADITSNGGGTLTTAGTSDSAACAIGGGTCTGYRTYAALASDSLKAWCVDSSGNSAQVTIASMPAAFPLKCK